jgi:hypothetical protein
MTHILYPDADGKLHHVKAHGVTVDIHNDYNKAFTHMQELGRRLGFSVVSLCSYKDTRDMQRIAGLHGS